MERGLRRLLTDETLNTVFRRDLMGKKSDAAGVRMRMRMLW